MDIYTYMFRMSVYDLHWIYLCFVGRYTDVHMRERVTILEKVKENDYICV